VVAGTQSSSSYLAPSSFIWKVGGIAEYFYQYEYRITIEMIIFYSKIVLINVGDHVMVY
jgi:hypothetical protein